MQPWSCQENRHAAVRGCKLPHQHEGEVTAARRGTPAQAMLFSRAAINPRFGSAPFGAAAVRFNEVHAGPTRDKWHLVLEVFSRRGMR